MPRPKQMTDEDLLHVALECFLKHGPNVSTQIIAERVGLSQPALFKRFGTKEEMFLRALTPPERLPVLEWLDASPSSDPFRPQLVQLLEKVHETLIWVLPRIQLLQESRIPRETVMARYKTPPPELLLTSIAGFFERAQQQGQIRNDVDARFIAQWVFGSLMGRSVLGKTIPMEVGSQDNTAFFESAANLLCDGTM